MCGVNYSGNLGFGDYKVRFEPEKVPHLLQIKDFYINDENCMAISFSNKKYIWGKNISRKRIMDTEKGRVMMEQEKSD